MIFEGEFDKGLKKRKGQKRVSIKIETPSREYELEISKRGIYILLSVFVFFLSIFVFDWARLKVENSRLRAITKTFYSDNSSELVKKIADLKKEIKKLERLNQALLSLVFGDEIEKGEKYPFALSASFQDGHIVQNLEVIREGLKVVYEELLREREIFEHFPTLWPVDGRITSGFGYRINPIDGDYEFHNGIDISAPERTPVLAAASGKVTRVGRNRRSGLFIEIKHANGIRTSYAHLKKIFVSKGEYVKKGQIIGLVGRTGKSTGPHLHFSVSYKGRAVDPLMFLFRY